MIKYNETYRLERGEIMPERIKELIYRLEHSRPENWDKIPDIDLYMDQIIGYMKRQHIGLEFDGDESLTPAMINNYMKSDLLPRACLLYTSRCV